MSAWVRFQSYLPHSQATFNSNLSGLDLKDECSFYKFVFTCQTQPTIFLLTLYLWQDTRLALQKFPPKGVHCREEKEVILIVPPHTTCLKVKAFVILIDAIADRIFIKNTSSLARLHDWKQKFVNTSCVGFWKYKFTQAETCSTENWLIDDGNSIPIDKLRPLMNNWDDQMTSMTFCNKRTFSNVLEKSKN